MNWRVRVRDVGLLAACIASGVLAGCGSSDTGPPRFLISGNVTFKDAPVPYGEIVFEPDSTANNSGPATRVIIDKGAYTTKNAKGIVGGATIVRITGYDGVAPQGGGTQPHGAPLFEPYETKLVLPQEESTEDFKVPVP